MKFLFIINTLTLACWSLSGNTLLMIIYSVAVFSSGMLAWGEWVDKARSDS